MDWAAALPAPPEEQLTARQRVEQAVRTVADAAADGLPGPWAQAVREAAMNGAEGLPEALDELAQKSGTAAEGQGRAVEEDERAGEDAGPGAAPVDADGGAAVAAATAGGSGGAHSGRLVSRPPRPAWW